MIYFYSTSAISEAKVRKSPDISETNGVTDHRKHKVQFPAPLEAKVIKKKRNFGEKKNTELWLFFIPQKLVDKVKQDWKCQWYRNT